METKEGPGWFWMSPADSPSGFELFRRVARDDLAKSPHDFIRLDAFGFGVEVGDDAMPQDGGGDGPDIFTGDVKATMQDGASFGRQDQELAGARAGSPRDIVLDEA